MVVTTSCSFVWLLLSWACVGIMIDASCSSLIWMGLLITRSDSIDYINHAMRHPIVSLMRLRVRQSRTTDQ